MKIEPVKRAGARVVIGLAGTSGSGKTYSAILLAYGMAGRVGNKVGFLDTENRRGSLYADILPNGDKFLIGYLMPPFSPAAYIEAIDSFEKAGVEVLVIDSVTHEYEGEGGCEDIANDGNPKLPRWNIAKREHKKFVNRMLFSSMHIIVCVRAREKTDMKNPKAIVSLGIQPVQEKNFMFEMTASLMMRDEGESQKLLKVPAELRGALGREVGYLTIEDGEAVRAWVDGGEPVDFAYARAKSTVITACENGIDAMRKAYAAISPDDKKRMEEDGTLRELQSIAKRYEAHTKTIQAYDSVQ